MAEKRYYWLKLKDDYFNSPKIKKLRKIAGGDTYTIIYLKMQLLSIRNSGIIEFEGIEPTIEEELALKLDEDVENVEITLSYLRSQGLCEENGNNEFLLIEASGNIGSEGQSADRVRLFRERQKGDNIVLKEPKSNALRQRQFRAKEICKQVQHIPYIEDYQNNKRYGGNYYLVLKRDEMKCALCGSIENLCVHHIDGYNEFMPQNNAENKMITLCRECHSRVHSNDIEIPKSKLESIGYYDICNESNEICNASVTQVKRTSISISNSISSSSNNYNNSNNKEEDDSTLNNKLNKIGIEVKTIYDYWQSKKIKKHQVLSEKIINIIKQALKTYDIDAIKQAIDRYEEVLHDNDYYFDTVWGLDKFLKQSNALPEFLDDGDKWISYQNKKSKQPKTTVKTGGDAIDELLRQELEKEMNEQGEIVI